MSMTTYTGIFESIYADFKAAGIPTDAPGFYDHPSFVAREHINPEYLNNYARFVQLRPYSAEYLQKAEKVIEIVATELHQLLIQDGRLGACIDCSIAFSRMLDKEGIWNYAVKGAVTIDFPASLNTSSLSFHPINLDENNSSGGQYGHKWIYAPPFDVIDITIKQQDYKHGYSHLIPNVILEKGLTPIMPRATDIVSPTIINLYRLQKISPEEIISRHAPHLKNFFFTFPANLIKRKELQFRYIPCGIMVSDVPFEEITTLKLNGLDAEDIYQLNIKPKLQEAVDRRCG